MQGRVAKPGVFRLEARLLLFCQVPVCDRAPELGANLVGNRFDIPHRLLKHGKWRRSFNFVQQGVRAARDNPRDPLPQCVTHVVFPVVWRFAQGKMAAAAASPG
jgi:hypothetical protein